MITMTSVEAQNSFGKLLDTAQREVVTITRHGRPTAYIVSPQEMDELLDARRSMALADFNHEVGARLASLNRGESIMPATARKRLEKISRKRRKLSA